MQELLTPIKRDVETVKSDVKALQNSHSSLESRVVALESGVQPRSAEWKPTYVEIQGFCEFAEARTHGIRRSEASEIVMKLKALLDPSLQPHVRELQLGSNRNHKFKIPVSPDYIHEIKNAWNEHLSDPTNVFQGKQLRARLQLHPDTQKRYQLLGKAKDWAEAALDPKFEPRTFWSPDFAIHVTVDTVDGPMGVKPAKPLCEIDEKGQIVWFDEGLTAVGKSKENADSEVKQFRRRRSD